MNKRKSANNRKKSKDYRKKQKRNKESKSCMMQNKPVLNMRLMHS
jgi:hypothetical protein